MIKSFEERTGVVFKLDLVCLLFNIVNIFVSIKCKYNLQGLFYFKYISYKEKFIFKKSMGKT